MRDHTKLRAFVLADEVAIFTYRETKNFPKQEEKGFTLLEVMVALVILIIGLMSVLSLVTSVIRGNAFSNKMTTATILAQDKMEELMALRFDTANDLTPNQHTDINNPINGLFRREWEVEDFGDCKRIDIEVGWQGIQRAHVVTLTTMLSGGDEL